MRFSMASPSKLTIPKSSRPPWRSPAWCCAGRSGTKGEFTEHAELPKDLWKLEAPKAEPIRPKAKAPAKQPAKAKPAADDKKDRAAILSFEKAKQRRDAAREKEQAEANAKREKEQARIERALAKAEDALDRAKAHHEEIAAAIAAEQEKLDRRAEAEECAGKKSAQSWRLRASVRRSRSVNRAYEGGRQRCARLRPKTA